MFVFQAKEGRSFDFSQGFVVHSVGASSATADTSAPDTVKDGVVKQNAPDNEPMRISLDFNDDIADEFDDEGERQQSDNHQLNDDMDLLVIGTALRPPPRQN